MKAEKGKQVDVHYVLHIDGPEGEVVEKTTDGDPLRFVLGEDPMLPKFEGAVDGLEAGSRFTLSITCADAYGEEEADLFMEFPKSEFFGDDGTLDEELFAEGEVIPMQTQDGQVVHGVVAEVKLNTIVIDFNHPLAGENLYFDGEVVAVAEPT